MPMRGNGMVILQTQQKLFAEPFNSGRSSAKCIFTAKYTFEKNCFATIVVVQSKTHQG